MFQEEIHFAEPLPILYEIHIALLSKRIYLPKLHFPRQNKIQVFRRILLPEHIFIFPIRSYICLRTDKASLYLIFCQILKQTELFNFHRQTLFYTYMISTPPKLTFPVSFTTGPPEE